jgi:hypothetical protein
MTPAEALCAYCEARGAVRVDGYGQPTCEPCGAADVRQWCAQCGADTRGRTCVVCDAEPEEGMELPF